MYFYFVLFLLHKVALCFQSVNEICKCDQSNVLLFIMLYKVVVTFESGDEILKCDHSPVRY